MRLQTLAHIQLLLNHFPTVAFLIALGLFIASWYLKSDYMKRMSLGIFLVVSLLSIPVYMTGKAAQSAIKDQPGVSAVLTETHQDAALLAITFMEITGVLAWIGLWQFRRLSRASKGNLLAVLVFSLITFALMARAANIGGEIRHPEILAEGQAAGSANTELLRAAPIANFINTTN